MNESRATPPAEPTPDQRQAIDVDVFTKRQAVEIAWADGHRSTYGFERLRWLCPCAVCRGEAGSTGMLDHTSSLEPRQYELTDLHQVGNYAITPVWADGHDTGIYSWRYLRQSCPCDDCRAAFGPSPA